MNSQHVKGAIKDTKGKVKEEVGHITGNDRQTARGVVEQVAGKMQKSWGDLKDSVKGKVDRALDWSHAPKRSRRA